MAISMKTPSAKRQASNRGFTIFFALLVGGLALAVGIAIYDLAVRELDLSSTATQSQYAIYAADTGAECALYWDFKCLLGACPAGSAFATSSEAIRPVSQIVCNGQDVAAAGTPPSPFAPPPTGWSVWSVAAPNGGTAATTTFTMSFYPQPYCATVTVAKYGSPTKTTVTSRGYNTCTTGGVARLERALQISY